MASFITFLRENKIVCPTVSTVIEARNRLASNNTEITKESAVLHKFGKVIGLEKSKEHKNIDLINGILNEYSKVKEVSMPSSVS